MPTPIPVSSVKMLREHLCIAQFTVNQSKHPRRKHVSDNLQALLDWCDQLRPIRPDGKHGDLHTPWCGCDEVTS